jgi:hypothetical protein
MRPCAAMRRPKRAGRAGCLFQPAKEILKFKNLPALRYVVAIRTEARFTTSYRKQFLLLNHGRVVPYTGFTNNRKLTLLHDHTHCSVLQRARARMKRQLYFSPGFLCSHVYPKESKGSEYGSQTRRWIRALTYRRSGSLALFPMLAIAIAFGLGPCPVSIGACRKHRPCISFHFIRLQDDAARNERAIQA